MIYYDIFSLSHSLHDTDNIYPSHRTDRLKLLQQWVCKARPAGNRLKHSASSILETGNLKRSQVDFKILFIPESIECMNVISGRQETKAT